ncbi:MAG: nitrous oxide reductase accessory protein NosL [Rhodocyclaceae bacterium]|jgi:copper chaperone NosL|nr:nitrous oxide reductase accessory protein NosL [Rhodocyclaceae bacterium]
MRLPRSTPILLPLLCLLLTACSGSTPDSARPAAVDFSAEDTCVLNGLRPSDHPGPKAQLHLRGHEGPLFYCDTVEALHTLLVATPPQAVLAAYVQDTAAIDWHATHGHWIDARRAVYVNGASRIGPLGRTLVSFAERGAAERFIQEYGGQLLAFEDITPDHVVIDGDALHDTSM